VEGVRIIPFLQGGFGHESPLSPRGTLETMIPSFRRGAKGDDYHLKIQSPCIPLLQGRLWEEETPFTKGDFCEEETPFTKGDFGRG